MRISARQLRTLLDLFPDGEIDIVEGRDTLGSVHAQRPDGTAGVLIGRTLAEQYQQRNRNGWMPTDDTRDDRRRWERGAGGQLQVAWTSDPEGPEARGGCLGIERDTYMGLPE